ncbi:MAG: O-antigen ligase family protein [Alloalcanivorax venustensis]|uniref:O-antigen ligase family protein n=1 Tax=Alloalcanivorax venustensis TaxID=172371 RepID=UPI003C67EE94
MNSLALAGFLVGLVLLPLGYAAFAALVVVLALPGALLPRGGVRLCPEDRWLLLALLLFGLHLVLDAWRIGVPVGHQTASTLPWWPLAAALVLVGWRRFPPAGVALWWGAAFGALAACGIVLVRWLALGVDRVHVPGINAIPFGNLSLVLGVLSLVWVLRRAQMPLLFGAAALAGLVASLLSGTRGGWVTLPVVAVVLFLCQGAEIRRLWSAWLLPARLLTLAGVALFAAFAVWQVLPRAVALVEDLHGYLHQGVTRTSVGLRLDMWHAAWTLFLQKPLLGWGEGAMMPELRRLIAAGELNEQARYFGFQLHSDVLDTLARRGLLGLITLLLMYAVPLAGFVRRLKCADVDVRTFALAGTLVVLMFAGFGLTQSQFRDERSFAAYLVLVVACWVLMRPKPIDPVKS